MSFLEWTGLICWWYLGISATICFVIILIFVTTNNRDFLKNKGVYWKLPLIFLFMMLSWPLLVCQIVEMSFDNDGAGYPSK